MTGDLNDALWVGSSWERTSDRGTFRKRGLKAPLTQDARTDHLKPCRGHVSAEDLLDKQLSQHSGRACRAVAFDWDDRYGFG